MSNETFRFNRSLQWGPAHIDINRDYDDSGLATGRIRLFQHMSGKAITSHTRTFPDDVSNESICISLTKLLED